MKMHDFSAVSKNILILQEGVLGGWLLWINSCNGAGWALSEEAAVRGL